MFKKFLPEYTRLIAVMVLLTGAVPLWSVQPGELHTLQWHASNPVWMRGPGVSWVQARYLAYAVGLYPRTEDGAEAWDTRVPADLKAVVGDEHPSSVQAQRQVYLYHGQLAADRWVWYRTETSLAAELLMFHRDHAPADEPDVLRLYREDGALLLEVEHRAGAVDWIDRLQYQQGLLAVRTRTDAAGDVLYTDSYSYRGDGALRLVERAFPDGSTRSSQYSFHQGLLRDELHGMPDGSSLLIRYDRFGRPLQEREYRGDERTEETSFRYERDADTRPISSRTVFPGTERRIEREFSDGLEIAALHMDGDQEVRRITFRYDDERRRIERREVAEDQDQRVTYAYTDDGSLYEERRYLGDSLQERRLQLPAGEDAVRQLQPAAEIPEGTDELRILFSQGNPALRVYYSEQRRRKEEVIQDGEILRTRSFSR
ncbi:hypothetical protein Spiaf_1059 [Spirochaeta africana DSM 8902]|uniref:Rhs family protein n=1 Tax=Spirochaeta africana (strain ATCC 700263 / DSM 8902 / Z-7692) TaxID=889378 RepID=H9UI03_SPIAZ|nr:hypothetical protein Spiaf_1059 [Spirochaeta africana DSM 8902]